MNLDSFPREPLLFGPSPVHPLDRLTAHLGGARLWAKRDDCNSGLAYGGNKTRKLEYLVADALGMGCDTLVSIGGVQSNHTRQVAAAAARLGLGCVLVQESWVDWPDVVYDRVGNIQLSRIMGADVRLVEAGFGIGFKESWEQALGDVEAGGGKPYAIRPAPPTTSWAASASRAGRRSWRSRSASSACSSTRSSCARSPGARRPAWSPASRRRSAERRVIGIDGSARPDETREQVARIARRTAELIEVGRDLRDDEIVLDDRYHAGTYGIPDEQTLEAIRTAGRLEGMITDPVYEGKSMAGMIDLVRSRRDRARLERPVRPPGRAARAERLRGALPLMAERLVRGAVEAFMERDLEGILTRADPEIELRSLLTEAERPLYSGHDGVREWFDAVFGVFPDWRPQPRAATYDEEDAVVIPLDVTAKGVGSGAPDRPELLAGGARAS